MRLLPSLLLLSCVGCDSLVADRGELERGRAAAAAAVATSEHRSSGFDNPPLPIKPPKSTAVLEATSDHPVAPKVDVAVVRYPERETWYWNGEPGNFEGVLEHLLTAKFHGVNGQPKFDPTWLRTLSFRELNALHADDHLGAVDWNYAVRAPQRSVAAAPTGHWETRKSCNRWGRCTSWNVWVPNN